MGAGFREKRTSPPDYYPSEVDFEDKTNVLKISEIHAFEEGYGSQAYCRSIGQQINQFDELYDLDKLYILGDTGSSDDVYSLLNELEGDFEVYLVAGDEDKVSEDSDKPWTGFYEQVGSDPWNTDIDYQIFDEGFEEEIEGWLIQAAHHPRSKDRDPITPPDDRSEDAISHFFSVEQDQNENTLEDISPGLKRPDIVLYDHVHMPYTRPVQDTALIGLGGRRFNYQRKDKTDLPEKSIHLTSLDSDEVHEIHFDAETNSPHEHVVFERREDELEMFDAAHLTSEAGFWKAINSRFNREKYRDKAKEKESQYPDLWSP